MPRANFFACSRSLDKDNLYSNSNNLPSMEVVGDGDDDGNRLMGEKII